MFLICLFRFACKVLDIPAKHIHTSLKEPCFFLQSDDADSAKQFVLCVFSLNMFGFLKFSGLPRSF